MSGVRIVLLCEDSQTNSFVRRFLKHRNFRERDIITLDMSQGRGAGAKWVRERYPRELRAIRQKQGAYLMVVTDADAHSTQDRRKQLDDECTRQKVAVATDDDPVIVAVPRRNIETWFEYLDGREVDETITYPKLAHERDCERHARRLYTMCYKEQRLAEPAPPSLVEACQTYRRLRR